MAKPNQPAAKGGKEVKVDDKVLKTFKNKMRRLAKHVKQHPNDTMSADRAKALQTLGTHKPRQKPKSRKWSPMMIFMAQNAARMGYRGNAVFKWGSHPDAYPYSGARYGVETDTDGKVLILAAGKKWESFLAAREARWKAEELEAKQKAREEARAHAQKRAQEAGEAGRPAQHKKPGHKPGQKPQHHGHKKPAHNAKPAPKKA